MDAKIRALLVSPRWCRSAPFAKPVVPDVYWIWAASPGCTSGSFGSTGLVATKASQSSNTTTSRRSGSDGTHEVLGV